MGGSFSMGFRLFPFFLCILHPFLSFSLFPTFCLSFPLAADRKPGWTWFDSVHIPIQTFSLPFRPDARFPRDTSARVISVWLRGGYDPILALRVSQAPEIEKFARDSTPSHALLSFSFLCLPFTLLYTLLSTCSIKLALIKLNLDLIYPSWDRLMVRKPRCLSAGHIPIYTYIPFPFHYHSRQYPFASR